MAKQTTTKIVDDIDGTDPAMTFTFAVNGAGYVIDLSDAHIEEFQAAVAKFVQAATAIPGRAAKAGVVARTKRKPRSGGPDNSVVRDWANQNGFEVSPRGRIAETVLAAYNAAHGG